jgi:phosphoglycolate phosphatase-like HAD superfamily hydrolase
MNKIVVFDFDGTIIDVHYRYFEVFKAFLEMNSLPKLSLDEYIQLRINGLIDTGIIKKYNKSSKLTEELLSFKLQQLEKIEFLEMDYLRPGVLELLDQLVHCGIRIELLTLRRNLDNLNWQLKRLSIHNFFSKITYNAGELSKSNYLKSLLGRFDDVVFIGDSDYDYLASIESRTKFYLVEDSIFSTSKDLEKEKRFSYQEILTELCGQNND